ncbi:nitroreductase family protein [uncultured Cardiobacterium sp.]|uniref:nitroreductase family protein n=1 Tax=uncultured Cardiobacterium sp. TaxID=417619 RepID=UPI00262E9F14|nr:nitroreductase family protein [uncultured Cardiobacterium sp.]
MSIKSLPALETALAHRSIRKFSDKPVLPEILAALMDAGRMASTSNHLQCVSVIRITDAAIRAGIRRAASDMAYVTECPEFLLFCVDFHCVRMCWRFCRRRDLYGDENVVDDGGAATARRLSAGTPTV